MEVRSKSYNGVDQEVDDLFRNIEDEHYPKPYNYAEQVLEKIETEYRQPKIELDEREKEKKELGQKLEELKKKLNKTKNVKNTRKTAINKTQSNKRRVLKAEIEKVKDKLYQIGIEEQGSNITSSDLVNRST